MRSHSLFIFDYLILHFATCTLLVVSYMLHVTGYYRFEHHAHSA